MQDWDPIGVKDYPEAGSEYDQYAQTIWGLLHKGANADQIVQFLNDVVKNNLGLRPDETRAKTTARKLIELDLKIN